MRQVYLNDTDVSNEIISVAAITTNAGDFGQLTINDLPNMVGNNQRGFWDQSNPASPFYGARELSKYTITIFNGNVRVYEGAIQGLKANNKQKTTAITLRSDIQKKLEQGLIYASDPDSNPATMVQQICSLYEIAIDASSFGRASAIYEADLVRTSAFFRGEDTIQNGIQQILEVGVGRVYSQGSRLYYDVFLNKDTGTIFTASDKVDNPDGVTLFEHPEVTTVEKEPLTGYKVDYAGGSAIFGNTEKQGKSIDGSNSSTVRIKTLQGAVWIGERWLDYFGTKQETITFAIPSKYGKSLSLTDPVQIEYRDREYIVDLISINNSLSLQSKLGGITR